LEQIEEENQGAAG